MSPRCRWPAVIAAALLAVSCAARDEDQVRLGRRNGAAEASAVEARTAGGERFLRRIDGDVQEVFRADLGGGASEWIATTGAVSGAEQASVLRFAPDGMLLARYRVAGASPWGAQLQVPMRGRVFSRRVAGTPCLVVTTAGTWAPSAIEVLEARQDGAFEPRARFWNDGSIDSVAVSGRLVAFVGLNNALKRERNMDYPVVAGAFEIEPSSGDRTEARGWTPRDPGRGYLRYFVLPETHGHAHEQLLPVETDGDAVRARFDSGLAYVLGARDGSVRVEASAEFRQEYEEARRADATKPSIDALLADLVARVQVFEAP